MDLTMLPLVFAQAQPAAPNASSLYSLALRRWCSGLTLSAPQASRACTESGPSSLDCAALLVSGGLVPGTAPGSETAPGSRGTRQDNPHGRAAGLARRAGGHDRDRLYRRLVDGQSGVGISPESRRPELEEGRKRDLVMLTKSRGLGELAIEQGVLAAVTPLRDVAGLADNLPLLIIAAIVVFRAVVRSAGMGQRAAGFRSCAPPAPDRSGWSTVVWGVRLALRALPDCCPAGRQHRSPPGKLPGHRGRFDPVFHGDLRRHSAGVALDRAAQRRPRRCR